MIKQTSIHFCISALAAALSANVYAKDIIINHPTVIKEVKHDTSLPLKYMGPQTNLFHKTSASNLLEHELTPQLGASLIPLKAFQGLGVGLGDYVVADVVPDISSSIGKTQFVESVNFDIGVFDKNTGQLLPGFPKPSMAIWAGFGGACETSGKGQQTVKYDQLAGRWVLSQAAFENAAGPFFECLAVSTSEDATGSYYRYAFEIKTSTNYVRLGLWTDAYYLALMADAPIRTPVACALERNKMLNGQAASMQCLEVNPAFTGPILPINLDGRQVPPSNIPGYIIGLNPPFNLMLGKFHVDFSNPDNTNIELFSIPVAEYKSACADLGGQNCAIQPNTTTRLSILSDRLMSKFIYRQFRDYGSMVATHSVEGPAPKFAPAIRWYELRLSPANPDLHPVVTQQATIAPDTKNRFMGAISIDRFTNIAIGYTVTSSLIYPSLELAYHNYNDPNNRTTIQPLFTGKASQTGVSDWGMRSNMTVDPVDECTFWYSNEYLKETGSMNWSTVIVKFKLAACK